MNYRDVSIESIEAICLKVSQENLSASLDEKYHEARSHSKPGSSGCSRTAKQPGADDMRCNHLNSGYWFSVFNWAA